MRQRSENTLNAEDAEIAEDLELILVPPLTSAISAFKVF